MTPTRDRLLAALAGLALFASPISALAQLPRPRLHAIYPAGGRAGETVEVQVSGTDLERIDTLWFDHPGLRAFHRKGATFTVAIAPGTPVGLHDVRAFGPLGLSNARTFVAGDRPEAREVEPNDTSARANPIALNSVVNGRSDAAADVDCFAFEGRRGQRIFLDLSAERIDTRLDATLHVFGPSGAEIAQAHDHFGFDPFLDLTLPADGRYVIQVHDIVYNGSADHAYRLTVHDGPHLDAIVPIAAPTGVDRAFTLLGRNLGGTAAPGQGVEGRPVERLEVSFTPPAPDPLDLLLEGSRPSLTAGVPGSFHRISGPAAWSNAVFVAEARDPVVLEAEPNDASHPQAVELPCDVSGTFGAPGDEDVYRFRARKGEVWWVEVASERLGAPGDPSVVIQRVNDKGETQDLLADDDLAVPGDPRFPTASVDVAVRWQAPEDGPYQVVVTDLYSSQRGDARHAYRLNIRPPRPDFRLFLVPADTTQPGALSVSAGGRASAVAVASRLDGFVGPIRVEALDLPSGVSCEPVTLGPNQSSAPVVFTADKHAPPGIGRATLVGRALSGDRKDVLDYARGANPLHPEPSHPALPGSLTWGPTNPGQTPAPPAPARLTRGLILAVVEPAPFLLTAKPDEWVVGKGETVEIQVEATRSEGMTEAIQVNATDLPPNQVGANVAIAKGSNSAVLKLKVADNVPPGNYTFVLRGTGPFPFNKDPNAKARPNVSVTEPSNPISLRIRR
jgi:hypothetical protein